MRRKVFFAGVLAGGLLLAGCAREEPAAPAAPKWTVKGRIVAVNPGGPSVTIDHQDIPGLMAAMTMSFRVAGAAVLEGMAAGDAVEFVLEQRETGLTVTSLRKIDPTELEEAGEQSYHGEGMVLLVNRQAGAVLLKHEGVGNAIPGGELVLPVVPPSQLEGIEDDTPVTFTLTKKNDQLVISELRKK